MDAVAIVGERAGAAASTLAKMPASSTTLAVTSPVQWRRCLQCRGPCGWPAAVVNVGSILGETVDSTRMKGSASDLPEVSGTNG